MSDFIVEYTDIVRPEWIDSNGHMNLAYYVVVFDLATDRLYDALNIGNAYREASGNSCFTAETHTLYEREVTVGESLRVGTTLLGADAKRLHYFHEMFHGVEGHRVAAQELLALHIDMGVRRVSPFPPDRLAAINAALQRQGIRQPKGAGRRIALPQQAAPAVTAAPAPLTAPAADASLPNGLRLTAMDPTFRECPHAVLDRLRAEVPVHYDQALSRWFLTRYDDIQAVVSDRALSVDPRKTQPGSYSRRIIIGDAPVETVELSMLHLDDPDHRRLRNLVTQAFNQRAVDAAEPRINAIAAQLLDALAGRDSFDVIAGYAAPLPVMVIAEMLGVADGDLAQFKRWSDALAQSFNPARTPEQNAALAEAREGINACFQQMIALRREQPGNDILSGLVAAHAGSDRLTEREIIITCNLLLVAGNLTTTDLIGNAVLALLEHPKELAKLRARPELVAHAIEEVLRYDPPVAQTTRVAIAPLSIGGETIAPGQPITVSLLAAGHDPAMHIAPDRFDIERADTSHLAFGGGIHYCLGAQLARAEARVALSLLLQRFPKLRLDPGHQVAHKPVPVFNGVETLWVQVV